MNQALSQAASYLSASLPNRSIVVEALAIPFSNALPKEQQKNHLSIRKELRL